MTPRCLLLLLLASAATAVPRGAEPASPFFDARAYGAVGDGRAKDTAALQRAADACAAAGGGTIVVPAGRYLTGSVHLTSHETLRLEAGAVLLYSPDPADSPLVPGRWEGTNAQVHGSLVYANGAEDVAVVGQGTLNGQGENWWWRTGRDPKRAARAKPAREAWGRVLEEVEAGRTPAPAEYAAAAEFLRPPLVVFYNCRNVLVEGVTLTDSPFWLLDPVYCEHVAVRGASFVSWGPNGDGIDVDSCRDVRISDSYFSTGDDCIVIKSGKDAEGRRIGRPTEGVAIANCVMRQGHGAVVIGSETSGGVRDVVATNIVCEGTDRGIRIKSMRGRGGVVENVRCDNFIIKDAPHEGIEVTALYGKTAPEPFSARTPVFRNFAFSHITIVNARQAVSIVGLPESAVAQLRFDDVVATARTGFSCAHAKDIVLRGVRVSPASGPPFVFQDVRGLVSDAQGFGKIR